jgi:hypothetical protein
MPFLAGWHFRFVVVRSDGNHLLPESNQDLKRFFLYLSMLQPLPYCTYVLFSEKDAMLYREELKVLLRGDR